MKEKVIVITGDKRISIREEEVVDGSLLDGLKEIVGGGIEVVRPVFLERPLCMVCNEEGLLLGLPVNEVASRLYGTEYHGNPIVGNIAIMQDGYRSGEPDLVGLEDGLIQDIFRQLTEKHPDLRGVASNACS